MAHCSTVVLAWHDIDKHEHDAFECCDLPRSSERNQRFFGGDRLVSKSSAASSKQRKTKRQGLMRFFRSRKRRESPVEFPMESLIMVEYKEPIFDDDRDDYICETREHEDDGVECILPSMEYQKGDTILPFDLQRSLLLSDHHDEAIEIAMKQKESCLDPWTAAKKGDPDTLMKFGRTGHNWSLQDDFQCTPLYYACQSGAAAPEGMKALRYLLDNIPGEFSDEHFDRCRLNAINRDVVRMLDDSRGALYGVVVDTKPTSVLDVLGNSLFGNETWNSGLLFGERIKQDDNNSMITISVASGCIVEPGHDRKQFSAVRECGLDSASISMSYSSSDSEISSIMSRSLQK